MKIIIGALAALSMLAGAIVPATAGPVREGLQSYEVKTSYKRKKYKKRYYRRSYVDGNGVYVQHWADKLPIGSSSWWQQMDREGRGGRRQ